jgi:hypothetical protein
MRTVTRTKSGEIIDRTPVATHSAGLRCLEAKRAKIKRRSASRIGSRPHAKG